MSYKIIQSVAQNTTYNIPLTQGILGEALEVWNGSPFDLDYLGFGSASQLIIPAGTGHIFYAKDFNAGKIQITAINNTGSLGVGVVNILVYNKGDIIPSGRVFPVPIPVQAPPGGVVASLTNENNPVGAEVIDIGVTGGPSKLVDIFNDHFVWNVLQSGVAHQVLKGNASGTQLQLGQTGDAVEALGSFTVDGILSAVISGGFAQFQLDAQGNLIRLGGSTQLSATGTGSSGTVSISVPIRNAASAGAATLVLAVITFQSFKQAQSGVNLDIGLGQAFDSNAFFAAGDQGSFSFMSGGVAQSANVLTTLAVGGGTVTSATVIQKNSIGWIDTTFDTIRMLGGNVSTHSGTIILVGH